MPAKNWRKPTAKRKTYTLRLTPDQEAMLHRLMARSGKGITTVFVDGLYALDYETTKHPPAKEPGG